MSTIGLLVCDEFTDDIAKKYDGAYEDLFIERLHEVDPTMRFRRFWVFQDRFPEDIHDCDSWLVTGSRAGSYEDLPWISRLKDFVRQAYAKDVPIVGVCFGHQLIAEALGGRVEKSAKGWGLGLQRYRLKAPLSDDLSTHVDLHCMHQDQVVALPPEATVTGTNDHCENAILTYKGSALSFQPHPEFSRQFHIDLTHNSKGKSFPLDLAEQSLIDLAGKPVQNHEVMTVIANFLNQID